MAAQRSRPHITHPPDLDDATFDAFAAAPGRAVDDVPVEERPGPRSRARRGGPRTPIPLLPVIVVCAGVGIGYVAQTAHLTQATYQATTLQAQQNALRQQDGQLGDELARLRSSARIDAAAQQMGMRPPGHWAYVPSVTATVSVPPGPGHTPTQGGADPMQKLVALLSGQFGSTEAEAAGP